MKAGKNQMSGFSSSHGSLDSLVVTHFSKKDHIGALTQGGTQGNQIIGSIRTDLALADNAFVMSVQVFQRVFQRDDMSFTAVIDLVDDTSMVVDFPLPAGPVIRTIPLVRSAASITAGGMCRSCGSGRLNAIIRMTAAREPRCRYVIYTKS